jgi:hypothetical protein
LSLKGGYFTARNTRISIKVENSIKEELNEIAQSYGLTISGLGAYIIGRWIREHGEKTGAALPAVNHKPGVPV